MDPCICMPESLCWSPETITTLLIGYTPIQNKKFKVGGEKKSNGYSLQFAPSNRLRVASGVGVGSQDSSRLPNTLTPPGVQVSVRQAVGSRGPGTHCFTLGSLEPGLCLAGGA